jgi:hypothetical protein
MSTHKPSRRMMFVGMLSIALGGCGDSDDDARGTGATTGGTQGSGGTQATGGTGGSLVAGGAGQSATGGSAGASGGASSGGTSATGGSTRTGGATSGGGAQGGSGTTDDTGGASPSGGSGGAGGMGRSGGNGGSTTGGTAAVGGRGGGGEAGGSGGSSSTGGAAGGRGGAGPTGGSGGSTSAGGGTGTAGRGGGGNTGTCTASQATGTNATGSGPHKVTVETNSDPGIKEGTIFRPTDLGGAEKYPIFVWGEGACTQNGLANTAAMAEIASHGYFVVADGTPNGTTNRPMDRSQLEAMAAPLIAYIDWAIAENEKPCSAYYGSLDTANIASNGFSCGGLMSQATAGEPRLVTWGVTSSGMAGADPSYYDMIHTPVLFVEGGPSDQAYDGAQEGYQNIVPLGVPVMWFSKDIGHGGDLGNRNGGDFTKINLAWLNWWLKGDETATGKGVLVGPDCTYCTDSAWEVMSENLP